VRVYFDNNATTPTDPRISEIMSEIMTTQFGNPASTSHAWGWQAEELVNIANENIAGLLGCDPNSFIFTSGATESINLALLGLRGLKPKRICFSTIEHKAVLDVALELEKLGFEAVKINVDQQGLLDLEQLKSELQKPTAIFSLIAANNEIGTIQDLKKISEICKECHTFLHLDITQLLGKENFKLSDYSVDLASFSGHKIYGPKGVGALYASQRIRDELLPIIFGGGHQRGLRSGTLNVPGIVGLGKACEILTKEGSEVIRHISKLTKIAAEGLQTSVSKISINGSQKHRIAGNLNLRVPGLNASTLLSKLSNEIALSSSSACLSQTGSNSHVLEAIGLNKAERNSSFRISIGRFNTEEETVWAVNKISKEIFSLIK